MKFTVDESENKVRGTFQPPLNFSISGLYVIDVPSSLSVEALTDSVSELIAAKVAAFKALHPTLPDDSYDELFTTTLYDLSLSDGVMVGDNKKVAILPGGHLFTVAFPSPSAASSFLHYYGFSMGIRPPTASDPFAFLYNYDPEVPEFIEFSSSDLNVGVYDSTGTSLVYTPTPDVETDVPAPPLTSYRLKFENVSSRQIFLSDWIFLTDSSPVEIPPEV